MRHCAKLAFGCLEIFFSLQLTLSFILFVAVLLHKNQEGSSITEDNILRSTLISLCLLVPTTCLLVHLIVHHCHTVDLVGGLRILEAGASFKVAIFSWVINVFVAVINIIAIVYCRNKSGPAKWELTLVFYILYPTQQACQMKCLYKLEMRTRVIKEGHDWYTVRRAMYILMSFFNGLLWLVSLSYMDSLSDLRKSCMDAFLTSSVFRIVHTVGRASMLAYRLESTLLFWKYYTNDTESVTGMDEDHEVIRPTMTTHTEIGKGRWGGGFLAVLFCGVAMASYIMSQHKKDINLYGATSACAATSLTIAVICIRLQCSGSLKTEPADPDTDPKGLLENVSEYLSGDNLASAKLLVFYSIAGITYHSVYALHMMIPDDSEMTSTTYLSMARQVFKACACVFLAMFCTWMNHKERKLRKWRALHMMVWMIYTMLFLDLAEECVNYSDDEYIWVIYVYPLAIDFKMYVFIHAMSDLMAAKTEYLIEHEREMRQQQQVAQERERQRAAGGPVRLNAEFFANLHERGPSHRGYVAL